MVLASDTTWPDPSSQAAVGPWLSAHSPVAEHSPRDAHSSLQAAVRGQCLAAGQWYAGAQLRGSLPGQARQWGHPGVGARLAVSLTPGRWWGWGGTRAAGILHLPSRPDLSAAGGTGFRWGRGGSARGRGRGKTQALSITEQTTCGAKAGDISWASTQVCWPLPSSVEKPAEFFCRAGLREPHSLPLRVC